MIKRSRCLCESNTSGWFNIEVHIVKGNNTYILVSISDKQSPGLETLFFLRFIGERERQTDREMEKHG